MTTLPYSHNYFMKRANVIRYKTIREKKRNFRTKNQAKIDGEQR